MPLGIELFGVLLGRCLVNWLSVLFSFGCKEEKEKKKIQNLCFKVGLIKQPKLVA